MLEERHQFNQMLDKMNDDVRQRLSSSEEEDGYSTGEIPEPKPKLEEEPQEEKKE